MEAKFEINDEVKAKFKEKKDKAVNQVKEKGNAVLDWMVDNPVKAGIVVTFGTKILGTALNNFKTRKNVYNRNTREYDPSLGFYYDLRRPLTNKEKLELSRRHNNGEEIGDILDSFNVLR